jgi:hypothetical protein
MNLGRKLIIAIVAAAAFLAGTSFVLPATTAHAASASDSVAIKWLYWSSYPTAQACNAEGDHLYLEENIETWKCPEYTEGDYFVWELWVVLGHGPGS